MILTPFHLRASQYCEVYNWSLWQNWLLADMYAPDHIQVAPTVEYIQEAYDPVKYGSYSEQPYLDLQIPTLTDSSLTPEGQHIISVTVKYMPYKLNEGNWDGYHGTIGDLVINTLSRFAPNFAQCIRQYKVITPLEMEKVYSLPEGNPVHGEMILNQFMWMRPVPGYSQY